MVSCYGNSESFNHILHELQVRNVFEDIGEFQEHFLVLDGLAEHIDDLVHAFLVHVFEHLETFNQLLNDLLQILLILLRQHAEKL